MKSQRRHELQENVLGHGLGSFVAWARAHSSAISWGVLALAVVVLLSVLWHRHSVRKEDELKSDFSAQVVNQSDAPLDEQLGKLKDEYNRDSDPYRKSATAYRIGQLYAIKALRAQGGEQKLLADQAVEWYRTVVDKYPKQYDVAAKAHMALGKIYEDRRDLTAAAAEYQAVAGMTNLAAGYPVMEFANQAREALNQLKEPARFASTSSAPATASAPASSSQPAEASAPATKPTSGTAPAGGSATSPK